MSDDIVDQDEYETGYRLFSSCMADAGMEVLDGGLSYDVYSYSFPAEARDNGIYDRCYVTHFEMIDRAWQVAHADTSLAARDLKKCLVERGFEAPETAEEIRAMLDANGITLEECFGMPPAGS